MEHERVAEHHHSGGMMKYIPSFNEFAGDVDLGNELDSRADVEIPVATRAVESQQNTDPWSSVFNPGQNPNMGNIGKQYYDVVGDPKAEPSTWEYIIKAEQLTHKSFDELDRNKDGLIDREELKAKFDSRVDADALIKQADRDHDGKISKDEFQQVLEATSA